jgi:hypothetical protein
VKGWPEASWYCGERGEVGEQALEAVHLQAVVGALPRWTHLYNVHRPHTALTGKPPISRLDRNNLLGNDS